MVDISKRRLFSMKRSLPSGLQNMVLLPWQIESPNFIEQCTRCERCIKSCPNHIIVKGDGGFPTIDFKRGECSFCYQCAQSCPITSLFRSHSEQAWQIKAHISPNCLAKNRIECRSCEEICEIMAIKFKYQVGSPAQPEIEHDLSSTNCCNGCGACVAVCPTNAITIK